MMRSLRSAQGAAPFDVSTVSATGRAPVFVHDVLAAHRMTRYRVVATMEDDWAVRQC